MPLLYSLDQHDALEAIEEELADGENLFAYLDDIRVVSQVPDRVSHVYGSLQRNLFSHAQIRVHGGKTQVWIRSGVRPAGCNVLGRIAHTADPRTLVCRESGGTDLPASQEGIVVLNTPLGDPAFIHAHLDKKAAEQRIKPCLRVAEPQSVAACARVHDEGIWACLCTLLNINAGQEEEIRSCANLTLVLVGVGLRSAALGRLFAHDVRQTPLACSAVGGPPRKSFPELLQRLPQEC